MALARGLSVEAAAREAKMSARTAYTYRKSPGFAERVREIHAEMFSAAVGVLAWANRNAAAGLVVLMTSKDERVKHAACRDVLTIGRTMRADEEFEHRLQALEAARKAETRTDK
jgi:hypothetical protein